MRFITEDDLRAAYKKHPFPSYETKAGERLTPGGRQFLNDRGVKIKDSVETAEPMDGITHQAQDKASPIHGAPYPLEEAIIRSVRARFLEAGASLLDMDVLAAHHTGNAGFRAAMGQLYRNHTGKQGQPARRLL